MRNKRMLWIVKGIVTIFNLPATWFVFFELFEHTDRPEAVTYFNTFMAILAIDAVFLWVIGILESDLTPIKRLPAAITSIMMAGLVVTIGIMDEGGILAFAPRAGMLLLVFNDIIAWITDWRLHYLSREVQEQRLRDQEVLHRREMNKKTLMAAIDDLEDQFQEKHRQRILDQLGLEEISERSETPTVVESKELPEGVVQVGDNYGWYKGQELITETTLGKPYTEKGAQLALSRHTKASTNGKH